MVRALRGRHIQLAFEYLVPISVLRQLKVVGVGPCFVDRDRHGSSIPRGGGFGKTTGVGDLGRLLTFYLGGKKSFVTRRRDLGEPFTDLAPGRTQCSSFVSLGLAYPGRRRETSRIQDARR